MSKFKNSLVAFGGLSLLIGLIGLITPARTQGQGGSNAHPLNVNVVNAPTVKATDLYPAQPIQKQLTVPGNPSEEACVSVPEDRGLIIELVTARTFSISNAQGHFVLGMKTIAGGETVPHNIPLQRQPTGDSTAFFSIVQPLRAYADPGTEVCFRSQSFDGGPFTPVVTFSGQLVNLP